MVSSMVLGNTVISQMDMQIVILHVQEVLMPVDFYMLHFTMTQKYYIAYMSYTTYITQIYMGLLTLSVIQYDLSNLT